MRVSKPLALAREIERQSRHCLWQPNNNAAQFGPGARAPRPIDAPGELGANPAWPMGTLAFFGLALLCWDWNSCAAHRGLREQGMGRGRGRTAGALALCVGLAVSPLTRRSPAQRPDAHPDPDPDADTVADAQSDTDGDQFQFLGRLDRDESRQQFPGAPRQSGDIRLRQGVAQQSGRRRRFRELPRRRGSAPGARATASRPRTGPLGYFVGDRRRTWGGVAGIGRARRARRQCRFLRRSKPHRHRHAAGAAVGDARSHPVRVQCLGRQGAVDLGDRRWSTASARSIQAATPGSASQPPATTPASTARLTRTQLLLEPGPEPHRAEGRVRICPRLDRIAPGDRRARSGDGIRRDGGARAPPDRRRDRALLDFRPEDFRPVGLRQVRRQCRAEFRRGHGQPRHPEHRGAGHRREPVWRRCRRVGFAQPEQHRAALHQLRRQVSRLDAVAPGHARRRVQMVGQRVDRS